MKRILFTGVLFGLLPAFEAGAHGMHLFAAVEGRAIVGRVSYAADRPAAGVTIHLEDADGDLHGEATSDASGLFLIPWSHPGDYELHAVTEDGHAASFHLDLNQFPGQGGPAAAQDASAPEPSEGLVREIRALREELNDLQHALRLRDILGGIGYILGAAGLLIWFQSRKASGR